MHVFKLNAFFLGCLLIGGVALVSGCSIIRDFDGFSFEQEVADGRDGGGDPPECVPGPKVCNGIDDDCNGLIDDGPRPCDLHNAETTECISGECMIVSCVPGYDDCAEEIDGCETRIVDRHAQCGACDKRCGPDEVCDHDECRSVKARWGAAITSASLPRLGPAGEDLLVAFPTSNMHTVYGAGGDQVEQSTVPAGTYATYIYRLSSDGRFSEPFVITNSIYNFVATEVAGSAAGLSYITGYYHETAPTLGDGSRTLPDAHEGTINAFIVALDPDMTVRWAWPFRAATGGKITPTHLIVGATGRLIIAGNFDAEMVTYLGPEVFGADEAGSFIVILSSNGDSVEESFVMNANTISSLASDNAGRLYALLRSDEALSIGDQTHDADLWILAAFDPKLDPLWSRSLGPSSAFDSSLRMDVSANGKIVVGTSLQSEVVLGDETLALGAQVLSFSGADGAYRSSRLLPDADAPIDPGVGLEGRFYATGIFTSSNLPDLGGGELSLPGVPDTFLASFEPDGDYRWAKIIGGHGQDDIYRLELHPSGEVTSIGSYRDAFTLDGIELPPPASRGIHFFRFAE